MSPMALFLMFFKISAVTFGGGIAILAMAKTELRKRGFPEEEMSDIAALATSMPGPIATSSAWLAGRKIAGIPGALASVAGILVPPFSAILILSGFVMGHRDSVLLAAFFKGVLCAVAALVATLVWGEVKRSLVGKARWINFLPYALVIALILWAGLHPLVAMACGVGLRLVLPEGNRWNC
jgi:chromate transporter